MKKNLIPLALGGLGIGTTEFVMMGLLPDIAKDFNISIPVAGHLISSYALGVVIGAPLLVIISSNFEPKKVLIALMAMFTIFNGFSAFAPTNTALLIARLLSGLPHGAFFGVGSVVASRLAEKGKQAQAISLMFAGLTIANLLVVPIGTFVGHHYSWRYTFGIVTLIGIITVICLQLWLPKLPISRAGNIKSELALFKRTEAWLIILITAIGTGGLFAWISYIAPLMTDVSHFSANMVSYIMILAGLGMVVGNVIGGKLADKMEPAKACIILLFAMAATLVLIYSFSGIQVVSLTLTFIAGALSIALATPIQILMIRTAREAEMLGAAATQAAFNVGNALGAFFGGLPIAAGLGYNSPSMVGAVMALTGTLFAWLLIKKQKSVAVMAY
ncbi:MFS transporter [Mucilaginibacter sp.]|uniref:MFS transporter n=1 Tax=Mucilaginibacter sp. TaxID=1882438 RepID=UPI003D09690D